MKQVIDGKLPYCEVFKPRGCSITSGSPLDPNWSGKKTTEPAVHYGILAGSFNPLHQGHLAMANFAQARLGLTVWFEMSIENVAKEGLSMNDLAKRSEQPFGEHGLVVTRASTFIEKQKLFPQADFLVGVDTILRIDDSRYYRSREQQLRFFARLQNSGTRFVVFGRRLNETFCSGEALLSNALKTICDFVDHTEFDFPVSSTELRRRGKGLR